MKMALVFTYCWLFILICPLNLLFRSEREFKNTCSRKDGRCSEMREVRASSWQKGRYGEVEAREEVTNVLLCPRHVRYTE